MPIRIKMMVMTIINSMIVNPRLRPSPRHFRGERASNRLGKSIFTLIHSSHHQSEYFVPSSAVPVDWEYMSKTFLPPHSLESGSSCTARSPQSALPVIGSMGILRKKRIFLSLLPLLLPIPPVLLLSGTPVTNVWRSGGYPSLPISTLIWL